MNILDFNTFVLENRETYIKKFCYSPKVIPQVAVNFTDLLSYLEDINAASGSNKVDYQKTLQSLKKGEAVIIGIRSSLNARKNSPEQYIDRIFFIPKNAIKNNPDILPFQATTVPSVAWFDTPVAILDDGEYKFTIGTHSFKSGKTIPALVPNTDGLGPKEIPVKRYSKNDDEVKTFDPPVKDIGTGTNFHYGLTPKGVNPGSIIPCVGGYSAGCQVIPTEEKWEQFWTQVKNSGQKDFWYAIIEEDKMGSAIN
jgi:hypothetical protein